MGVNTMGILGIMDLAIEMGFAIDKKKLVKQLREAGFRVGDKLYRRMFPGNWKKTRGADFYVIAQGAGLYQAEK